MIRSVAKTPPAPIPLLIASPGVAPEIAQRLRDALLSLGTDEESSTLLAGLVIRQFRCPEAESYRVTQDWAEGAARRRLTLG